MSGDVTLKNFGFLQSNFTRIFRSGLARALEHRKLSRLSASTFHSILTNMAPGSKGKVPVLLLKTKSAPADTYAEYFSTFDDHRYDPIFVPVLEHTFKQGALDEVRQHIISRRFTPKAGGGPAAYGAMIFTSQRAVEAFTQVIEEIRREGSCSVDELLPEGVPFYVVGPATARGLKALNLRCPILGEESGNGQVLSKFILEHYNNLYSGTANPSILFLVGEKRRDIIPKTLQSEELSPERRSNIDELVIYDTGEMRSFKANFSSIWRKYAEAGSKRQWVVVFSPQGCKAMLESLGLLDAETGKVKPMPYQRNILVATIGPTTRDYLINEFDFTPDVCAEKPSPEGVANGIKSFTQANE